MCIINIILAFVEKKDRNLKYTVNAQLQTSTHFCAFCIFLSFQKQAEVKATPAIKLCKILSSVLKGRFWRFMKRNSV